MKPFPTNHLLIYLLVLLSSNVFGQKILSKKPINQFRKISEIKNSNTKFSASTLLFLSDSATSLNKEYIRKNNSNYINTALILNSGCSIEDINDLPILINTGNKNTLTALIPVNSFELVSKSPCIKKIDIGNSFGNSLDEARDLTNVNLIHQGSGLSSSYDGSGVIIGVIDEGFDFTHPTFRDELGNSRISRVWIQGDNTGSNPSGYNYGSEYIGGTQILAKQFDKENSSHGTHVAGIAAGSGFDGDNDNFKGIAFNSEIVFVSYYIPDDQIRANTNINVIDALNYLVNYAKSVNKPLVINMSFGTHIGSHDGTSLLDQEIDNLVDKGIIIVGAAGNEGNRKIHASSNFGMESSKFYFIDNKNSEVLIDIWGDINSDFDVNFSVYNTASDEWIAISPDFISTQSTGQGQKSLVDVSDNDKWNITYVTSHELNLKPRAFFRIDYSEDLVSNDGDVFAIEIKAENTSINAWCTSPGYMSEFNNYGYLNVENGNNNITIREIGGTANKIITVGAFTSKNNYTDFLGINRNIPFFEELGEIAPFSSIGSTVDGRMKPDITAPGNAIASSVSSFDINFLDSSPTVVKGVTDGSLEWWYANLEGTSMASPIVTGIIALWLEARPSLTVDDVKAILDNTSTHDSYTGTSNNNIWGRGKIDAWLAMFLIEQSLDISEKETTKNVKIYPNPTQGSITIKTTFNYLNFELYNLMGKKINEFIVTPEKTGYSIDLKGLQSGVYFLSASGHLQHDVFKVVKTSFTD
ncbi:S8 family serine peptidase [Flavivirga spongiicola]|uniref:S8 family peptidase n=1 Tax=Flavivirga spongiicola TaxID=421621 RepID=A0ABU7XYP1_9FLAO|nr:S8 family serine peptidase [Flavivirga sp. MEBiC05379]MDO5980903.1 S8 family serine peptidase [Flavivirga sp. MEBiC05379]